MASAAASRNVPSAEPVEGPATGRQSGNVFSARARVLGMVWVGVAVVLAALTGQLVKTGGGWIAFSLSTSSMCTTPALTVAWLAVGRTQGYLRSYWRLYSIAIVVLYVGGVFMSVYVFRDREVYRIGAYAALTAVAVCWLWATQLVVRARSGSRAPSVDLVESGLAIVALGAPLVVLRGEAVTASPYAWYAGTTLIWMVVLISALWTGIVLFVRSAPGHRWAEAVVVACAVAGVIDGVLQIEHIASGFKLPVPFLMAVHAFAMGMLLLVPLHATRSHTDRVVKLPPQAQIRTGRVVAGLTMAALPLLLVANIEAGSTTWALAASAGALVALVSFSTVRHLLAINETRRLYAEVEQAAEDRRALLAAVLEGMEDDRRRVAAQLHEQAASSYAAFASLSGERSGPLDAPKPSAVASNLVTARLAAQAESLRELTAAIRPLTPAKGRGLSSMIHAYVHSLYGGVQPVPTTVEVDDGLELDWVTETIALRVVQEAVRNTWQHAAASRLRVVFTVDGDVPVVRVEDDGIGFDPGQLDHESGIAVMRRFVAFCGGDLRLTSGPDGGTVVEAFLGHREPEEAVTSAPLRLVPAD